MPPYLQSHFYYKDDMANKYKSGLERRIAAQLQRSKVKFTYEQQSYHYTLTHRYTPDFFLANGIIIETKGRWTGADRKKHKQVRKEHPELDIRLLFQQDNTLSPKSDTTYSDYCNKHGIKYAFGQVPASWLR